MAGMLVGSVEGPGVMDWLVVVVFVSMMAGAVTLVTWVHYKYCSCRCAGCGRKGCNERHWR